MTVSYLTTLSLLLGKPPEAIYQHKVLILLPVTDNLLFLNLWEREIFSTKECARQEHQFGTTAYKANTLPTNLPCPVMLCETMSEL